MIQCFIRDLHQTMRIVKGSQCITIPYRMFWDDRHVRRFLRELSRGRCDTRCRGFSGWSRTANDDTMLQFHRLQRQVERNVPLGNCMIKIHSDRQFVYLTKGTIQLAICSHSARRERPEFIWFRDFMRGGRGNCRGVASFQNFAILEDSISSTSDYDSCYEVLASMCLTRTLALRSVLA